MGKLFGTDGARGIAGGELTCGLAVSIGQAAAAVLAEGGRPRILIGKDPRLSSDMLEAALAAGCASVGAEVELLGVVPTPAVADLVRCYGADGGIVISASHHSFEYNGISLFDREGYRLSSEREDRIEAVALEGAGELPCPQGRDLGRVTRRDKAAEDYLRRLIATAGENLRGMKLAVDCANGAASLTARRLFEGLGAECVMLHDTPDGTNINRGCGAAHPEALAEYVKSRRLFGGVAFDGAADRCLAVDEKGNLIDGDKILFALALDRKERGLLPGDTAVATAASNLGFFRSCAARGIRTAIAPEGGRYLAEEMRKTGSLIGGEPSGRLVLGEYATVGDGQLAAVQLLSLCREKGWKLSRMGELMERYPQVVLNVKADPIRKAAFAADPGLAAAIRAAEEALGEDGRVTVRPSGTEPLIRVLVEGKDFDRINRTAVELADLIRARTEV